MISAKIKRWNFNLNYIQNTHHKVVTTKSINFNTKKRKFTRKMEGNLLKINPHQTIKQIIMVMEKKTIKKNKKLSYKKKKKKCKMDKQDKSNGTLFSIDI